MPDPATSPLWQPGAIYSGVWVGSDGGPGACA